MVINNLKNNPITWELIFVFRNQEKLTECLILQIFCICHICMTIL